MKLKIALLSLLIVVAFISSSLFSQCIYKIVLYDDYGDGWNGGSLDLFIDGDLILEDVSLNSGSGPEFVEFMLSDSAEITTEYTEGSWAYENSYEIINVDSIVVYTDGANGIVPEGIPHETLYGDCYLYGIITGIVLDYAGNAIYGATIHDEYAGIVTQSDELGKYIIYDIDIDTVYLQAWKEYYYPVTKEVVIVPGDTVFQNFVLGIDTKVNEIYDSSYFQVYPNPTSHWLNIDCESDISHMYIVNNVSDVIISLSDTDVVNRVDVSRLKSGIYYLRIVTSKGSIHKKIFII